MRRLVKDILLPIAVAISLAFVIQAAVAKPYEIPTGSMYPTIKEHDRIIANRLIYRFRDIQRGDIVVFEPPQAAKDTCSEGVGEDVPFVKRVIGLPGDVVEVRQVRVREGEAAVRRYRDAPRPDEFDPENPNAEVLREEVVPPGELTYRTFVNGEEFVVEDALTPDYEMAFPEVPADSLLVLGDNRSGSCDSHQWGEGGAGGPPRPFVPQSAVIGQAEITYWPIGHITFL